MHFHHLCGSEAPSYTSPTLPSFHFHGSLPYMTTVDISAVSRASRPATHASPPLPTLLYIAAVSSLRFQERLICVTTMATAAVSTSPPVCDTTVTIQYLCMRASTILKLGRNPSTLTLRKSLPFPRALAFQVLQTGHVTDACDARPRESCAHLQTRTMLAVNLRPVN